ncbi:hypothetical protein TNCV_2298731 [Trichonephila clavipes]|nr:hypothetical protein TNCV_2298731 [Trichonephila clavipes]
MPGNHILLSSRIMQTMAVTFKLLICYFCCGRFSGVDMVANTCDRRIVGSNPGATADASCGGPIAIDESYGRHQRLLNTKDQAEFILNDRSQKEESSDI